MNTVFVLLTVQALMGAFDNAWHHELQARLPQRPSARHELALHAAREAIYGVVFIGLGWLRWEGGWAWLLAGLLAVEMVITAADFLEEDRSRRLPPFERVLHTVLAVTYGAFLGAFAATWWAWAGRPTGLVAAGHGAVAWLLTAYGLGVSAWSLRNGVAVWRLHRLAAAERQAGPHTVAARATPPSGPALLVTGGTGFIGTALVQSWVREGRRVIVWSRDALQARAAFGPAVWVVERLADIPCETVIEAVVHLAGAPVLGAPWTRRRRRLLIDSRVDTANALLQLMRRLDQPPRVLVSASAVGYYGVATGEAVLDESAPPQPGCFQSELCVATEHEARRAEGLGVRVVRLRLGIVLGRQGGAYPPLAFAARLGLGAVLGRGTQALPWLHHDDAVGLVRFAVATPGLAGAVNAVAPEPATQAGFARATAAASGRRVFLRAPGWLVRAALGEMSQLLLCGQRAVPSAATAAGYPYRHASLASALAALAQG